MWADIEDVVVARLADLFPPGSCRAGDMPLNPTYPYCQVTRVAGGDDKVTDYPSVDIDLFDKRENATALSTLARRVHHERMAFWSNKDTVVLPTGERVRIDRCHTAQAPIREDYDDDTLARMVGRYRLENRAQTAA
jgi:hypothetical protein